MDVFFWLGFIFVFFVIGILIAHRRAMKNKPAKETHCVTANSVAIETEDGAQIAYSGDIQIFYEVPK